MCVCVCVCVCESVCVCVCVRGLTLKANKQKLCVAATDQPTHSHSK